MNECSAKTNEAVGFEFNEAVQLMNQWVFRKTSKPMADQNLGRIAGMLLVNAEIEVVVKFIDEINQYNKAEFLDAFEMLDDDD